MSKLTDVVCLVTGATRGIGRGVAMVLGSYGATVYITGRTLKPSDKTPKGNSLQELAEEITAKGGKAIPVQVDHSKEAEVKALFDRINKEQNGRLDVAVLNAFAAGAYLAQHYEKHFYDVDHMSPGEVWDIFNSVGLRNNYICSVLAARLMIDYQKKLTEQNEQPKTKRIGLIIHISSIGAKKYLFNTAYGVGKCAIDRMCRDMAIEFKKDGINISILSLWPGVVRTEAILAGLAQETQGVTASLKHMPTESPELTGVAIAALISEPAGRSLARSGQVHLVTDVTDEFGIKESDGSQPVNLRSKQFWQMAKGPVKGPLVPSFIRMTKSQFMKFLEESD